LTDGRARGLPIGQPPEPLPLEIDPVELSALRAEPGSCALLDVREPWEVAICGFAEAIHRPLSALVGHEQELPRDRPLIVICHTGRRSLLATQHLRRLGWRRAVNLRGGVEAYALEVDPSMARY
jgi:rhodanese-related sulfurtransferase